MKEAIAGPLRGTDGRDLVRRYPFDLGFLLGAMLSGALFIFVARGAFPLTNRTGRQHYYSAAAIALLHGRLDIAPHWLGGECFMIHNRCYGYFGVTPSLIRLPVALLAGTAMIRNSVEAIFFVSGFLTLCLGVWWLSRQLVALWAPSTGIGARRLVGFLAAIAALAASPVMFLVSRTMVYEEAILWGVAFATIGLGAAVSAWLRPRPATLAILIVADFLAVSARPSVGASALFATVVLGIRVYRRSGSRLGGVCLIAGAVLAFASAPAMAAAKFGTLSPPYQYHVNISRFPAVERLLSHPGGVNVVVLPTKVLSSLRPDSLVVSSRVPYLQLGEKQPTIIPPARASDVYWEPTSSLSATMPFSTLVATIGLLGLAFAVGRWATSRVPDAALGVTTLVFISALGALMIDLSFPGQSYRYLADCLPILSVLVAVGMAKVAVRLPTPSWGRVALVGAASFVLGGQLVIQTALAIENAMTNQGETVAACPGPPNPYGALGRVFCPPSRG